MKTIYFYCNRSGFFKSESKGIRNLNTQGSSKANTHCTAGMQLQFMAKNKVQVVYSKSHYGHTCNLGHIPISREVRLQIAGDIAQGISIDKLLDNVRDTIGSTIERMHSLTGEKRHNIERSFGLRRAEKHKDDALSVHLWVEEVRNQGQNNPVLFYKPQGQTTAEIGMNRGLDVNDLGEHESPDSNHPNQAQGV